MPNQNEWTLYMRILITTLVILVINKKKSHVSHGILFRADGVFMAGLLCAWLSPHWSTGYFKIFDKIIPHHFESMYVVHASRLRHFLHQKLKLPSSST